MAADVRCRTVLLRDSPLTGVYTTHLGVTLVAGDLVLNDGTDPTLRDIYQVVSSGAWTRRTDIVLTRWMDVLIEQGADEEGDYGGALFTLSSAPPYVRNGSAPLVFPLRQRQPHPSFSGDFDETLGGLLSLQGQPLAAGVYGWGIVNERGIVTDVFDVTVGESQIEGLSVSWTSSNSVTVGPGSAFVPASGQVDRPDAATLVFPGNGTLAAGTWYYLYLHEDNDEAQIEVSPQRPAGPYLGTARVKGGGTGGVLDNTNPDVQPNLTRRYIPNSAFYTTAANTIRRFQKRGEWTRWNVDQTLLGAFATTLDLVNVAEASIASLVPHTAESVFVYAWLANSTNTSALYVTAADDGLMPTIGAVTPNAGQLKTFGAASGATRASISGPISLGASRALRHHQSAQAGVSNNGDVLGYWEST